MEQESVYTPLISSDWFRLIELQPGTAPDTIVVRMQSFELSSAPSYDAISYVWGDQTKTIPILCDSRPFYITENLYWSLARLRDSHEPRVIWTDAICINQADNPERNGQVAHMGSIYRNARTVFICMGDDPDGGAQHVAALVNLPLSVLESSHLSHADDSSDHPLRHDDRWRNLAVLMSRPWFSRVWVVQEAGLAKDARVLYGRYHFSYRDLLRLVYYITRANIDARSHVQVWLIHFRWHNWREPEQGSDTLFDLVSHGAVLKCKNPRDYLYAFLGHPLALSGPHGNGRPFIEPDYGRSVESIYHEASLWFLKQVGLRFLSSVEHNDTTISEELPSWVVRWDVTLAANEMSAWSGDKYILVDRATHASFDNSQTRLSVRGAILDKIEHVYRIDFGASSQGSGGFMFPQFEEMSSMSWALLPLTIRDIIGRLDAWRWCPSLASASSTYTKVHAFLQTLLAGRPAPPILPNPNDNERLASQFRCDLPAISSSRCFAITEKGYYCLTPWVTMPGDVVAVLFGTRSLFALRPCVNSGCRLLGEAYVHGMHERTLEDMFIHGMIHDQVVTII
ncbi:heterokaryon incompatibility protein-domain-containing protein [Podospora appendiculata]|uniref:Heterokaryon incompatibility protein-domain-containing protein n=1 Tax=Podospora appendiculata TaxID=314037 RepID=A0AAE1C9I0_9PEZI|nr:heterokaryon incompatibility protein-domain-containing protein [Podospora appendiculata]